MKDLCTSSIVEGNKYLMTLWLRFAPPVPAPAPAPSGSAWAPGVAAAALAPASVLRSPCFAVAGGLVRSSCCADGLRRVCSRAAPAARPVKLAPAPAAPVGFCASGRLAATACGRAAEGLRANRAGGSVFCFCFFLLLSLFCGPVAPLPSAGPVVAPSFPPPPPAAPNGCRATPAPSLPLRGLQPGSARPAAMLPPLWAGSLPL